MDFKPDEIEQELKNYFDLNKHLLRSVKKSKSVNVDVEELIGHYHHFGELLQEYPSRMRELVIIVIGNLFAKMDIMVHWTNIPKFLHESIANLRSKHLGKLVTVEGVIRQITDVKHLVRQVKFECPGCGTIISVEQTEKELKTPGQCTCGRKGGFREISKDIEDIQYVIVEETHENTERNNQPKRVKCRLLGSLCDKDKVKRHIPGSLVRVTGVLREDRKFGRNNVLVMMGNFISVNNIIALEDDEFELNISEEDEKEIRAIAGSKDGLEKVTRSIAPSIFGYNHIKKAMAFQLFGGVSRKRSDGGFTREMINGLLVGDPSLGKSVFLRFMSSVTPRGRFVSGKSSSGVGLTAAVTKSELTGGWSLEAGAIVLANGSICGIDEGDKMKDEDRSNLHEAMSLGTVTIAKAGIMATLPARTSILMAANPKLGRFSSQKSLIEQINLVPSLLSRFDFIYLMRDKPHEDLDNDIANTILNEHMEDNKQDILSVEFIRKYLHVAKQLNPVMTAEASSLLKDFYVKLRKQTKEAGDGSLIIPITPRQLESLVRLSEAHARLKLRKSVGIDDAKQAIKMMKDYLMEFGYDEKLGAFDVDKLIGTSASTRGKYDAMLKIVRLLETKSAEGFVKLEEIEDAFKDKMDKDEVYRIVEQLNSQGDLFQTPKGYRRV